MNMKMKLPVIFHRGQRWAVVYSEPDGGERERCLLRGEDGRQAEAYIPRAELEKAEVRLFKELDA